MRARFSPRDPIPDLIDYLVFEHALHRHQAEVYVLALEWSNQTIADELGLTLQSVANRKSEVTTALRQRGHVWLSCRDCRHYDRCASTSHPHQQAQVCSLYEMQEESE